MFATRSKSLDTFAKGNEMQIFLQTNRWMCSRSSKLVLDEFAQGRESR